MKDPMVEMFDIRDVAEWLKNCGWETRRMLLTAPSAPIISPQASQQQPEEAIRWFHPDHDGLFAKFGFSLYDAVIITTVQELEKQKRLLELTKDDGK